HDGAIDEGALPPRGQHAERDGDADADDHREQRQRDRRLRTLADQRRHRQARIDRGTEIAAYDAAEPDRDLRGERLVEPELGADLRDVLGRRVVARDDDRRVAGCNVQQREDRDGHHAHDGNGGHQSARDLRQHDQVIETFQNTGAGNWSTPLTDLRYAVGSTHWPNGTYSTSSYAIFWISSASCF